MRFGASWISVNGRRMNTPSFAPEVGNSRPGTPISDIPSLLDLPSALEVSSDYPLHLIKPTPKKRTFIYQLPDLDLKDSTPHTDDSQAIDIQPDNSQPPEISALADLPSVIPVDAETSTELVLPSTRPLRLQAHHLEPAPGVHVRVIQFDPPSAHEMLTNLPKIEIFLDIDAEAPRVHMDIKAKGAGECLVHIHKPSAFPGEADGQDVESDDVRSDNGEVGVQECTDQEDEDQEDGDRGEEDEDEDEQEGAGQVCGSQEEDVACPAVDTRPADTDVEISEFSWQKDDSGVDEKGDCQCLSTCHCSKEDCSVGEADACVDYGLEYRPRSL
jgi:hypothetical protein